jgi:hypothetical protein
MKWLELFCGYKSLDVWLKHDNFNLKSGNLKPKEAEINVLAIIS